MPNKMKRWVDSAIAGAAAYALLLGWSACSGGAGSGGGLPGPEGGPNTGGTGGGWVQNAQANTSGSRIKAHRLAGSDGFREFQYWVDIQRNERCAFWLTPEGKRRCVPSGPEVETEQVNNYFADPNCSVPAVRRDEDCPPKYGLLYQSNECTGNVAVAVHPINGGKISLYSRNSVGQCEPLSATGYALGAPLPLDAFFEAIEQTDP